MWISRDGALSSGGVRWRWATAYRSATTKGDVIDIRVFQFSILEVGNWVDADQSTGRIINIPNGKVFTETMVNYTTGFEYIWNEMPVLVTFESEWEKAKEAANGKIAEKRAAHTSEEIGKKIRAGPEEVS